MPVTMVAVIYSISQNRRRRVVKPDFDDSEIGPHIETMAHGEGVYLMPISLYETVDLNGQRVPSFGVDAALALHLGAPPADDKCAVVDLEGNISAIVAADPRIDYHPHGFLIQEPAAVVGEIYDFESAGP